MAAPAASARRAQRASHNPPPVARRYYTVDQAAALYGVNSRTVRKWLTEGRLTAYRVGGRLIRLDAAEVEALAVRCDPSSVSA